LCGVKPIGKVQWERETTWLYGAVEPKTGEGFFYEMKTLDTAHFQEFLNEFSKAYPNSLNIIQLDNGSFHKSEDLEIPENVILLFQPSNSPELNPIERVWEEMKKRMRWENYPTLNALQKAIQEILETLETEVLASLTGWDWILDALSRASI